MPVKKLEKTTSVAELLPNSIIIKIDGGELRVPLDKYENALANMVLAGQGRDLIQRTMASWRDKDELPSPKELRDIIAAMRDLATFSQEVHDKGEVEKQNPDSSSNSAVTDIDFSDINKIPTVLDPIKPDEPATGNPP